MASLLPSRSFSEVYPITPTVSHQSELSHMVIPSCKEDCQGQPSAELKSRALLLRGKEDTFWEPTQQSLSQELNPYLREQHVIQKFLIQKNQEIAHSTLLEIWRQILEEMAKVIENCCLRDIGIEWGRGLDMHTKPCSPTYFFFP